MNEDDNPTARAIRAIRADERQRCIKALEALRRQRGNDACPTWAEAIAALSEASTPVPVASSPVGGEQHG